MRKRIPVLVSGLLLLGSVLAGCSVGTSSTAAVPSQSSAPTVQQVANQLGATGVTPVNPPTLFATYEGTATLNGQSVDIATFSSEQLRKSWEQVAGQFGPIIKDGPRWAVVRG